MRVCVPHSNNPSALRSRYQFPTSCSLPAVFHRKKSVIRNGTPGRKYGMTRRGRLKKKETIRNRDTETHNLAKHFLCYTSGSIFIIHIINLQLFSTKPHINQPFNTSDHMNVEPVVCVRGVGLQHVCVCV